MKIDKTKKIKELKLHWVLLTFTIIYEDSDVIFG